MNDCMREIKSQREWKIEVHAREKYIYMYMSERERERVSHQGIYTSRCLSLREREKVMEEYIYGTSTSRCLREREREGREGCSLLNQYHHIMRFPILLHWHIRGNLKDNLWEDSVSFLCMYDLLRHTVVTHKSARLTCS